MKGFSKRKKKEKKKRRKKKKEGQVQYETNMLGMELTWKEQSYQKASIVYV